MYIEEVRKCYQIDQAIIEQMREVIQEDVHKNGWTEVQIPEKMIKERGNRKKNKTMHYTSRTEYLKSENANKNNNNSFAKLDDIKLYKKN